MKLNLTIPLTFLFLLMMIGTGSVSALIGYNIGYKSLKGVSQPDINPTRKLKTSDKATENQKGLVLVEEKTILVKNYDYIHSQKNKSTKPVEQKEKTPTQETPEPDNEFEKTLSLNAQDKSIILEAVKVSKEDNSLSIAVNLKNNGKQSVRFVYSFLEVKDDQGRVLSTIADGLPGELPANGNIFSGTLKIPNSLLVDSEKLFLTLTDYPDQNIKLTINDIPVIK